MMEEHQNHKFQDKDATNTTDCKNSFVKRKEEIIVLCIIGDSQSVSKHYTDLHEKGPPSHTTDKDHQSNTLDKGHPSNTLDKGQSSCTLDKGHSSCTLDKGFLSRTLDKGLPSHIFDKDHQSHTDKAHPSYIYTTVSVNKESGLSKEEPITSKEYFLHSDRLTTTSQSHFTSGYIKEEISEEDDTMACLIEEDPHSHNGQNSTTHNSDSDADQPSADQCNSPNSLNEIEVIYQNPPNSTFGDIANLTRYWRKHSRRTAPQCSVCGKYFMRRAHLLAHEVTHTEQFTVICSKCGESFPCSADLIAHKKMHGSKSEFLCSECGRCFQCRGHLALHQKRHLREREKANT